MLMPHIQNTLLELHLLLNLGNIYSGCNIENDGILSICAERVAFVKALSEGEKNFDYIVICGGPNFEQVADDCTPCGYCRQFMREFVDDNFKIYTLKDDGTFNEYTITDLLPHSFNM